MLQMNDRMMDGDSLGDIQIFDGLILTRKIAAGIALSISLCHRRT